MLPDFVHLEYIIRVGIPVKVWDRVDFGFDIDEVMM